MAGDKWVAPAGLVLTASVSSTGDTGASVGITSVFGTSGDMGAGQIYRLRAGGRVLTSEPTGIPGQVLVTWTGPAGTSAANRFTVDAARVNGNISGWTGEFLFSFYSIAYTAGVLTASGAYMASILAAPYDPTVTSWANNADQLVTGLTITDQTLGTNQSVGVSIAFGTDNNTYAATVDDAVTLDYFFAEQIG